MLDTARFSYFVAERLGVPVGSVQTLTLGSHGDTMVPVPSACQVDGTAAGRPARRRRDQRAGRADQERRRRDRRPAQDRIRLLRPVRRGGQDGQGGRARHRAGHAGLHAGWTASTASPASTWAWRPRSARPASAGWWSASSPPTSWRACGRPPTPSAPSSRRGQPVTRSELAAAAHGRRPAVRVVDEPVQRPGDDPLPAGQLRRVVVAQLAGRPRPAPCRSRAMRPVPRPPARTRRRCRPGSRPGRAPCPDARCRAAGEGPARSRRPGAAGCRQPAPRSRDRRTGRRPPRSPLSSG